MNGGDEIIERGDGKKSGNVAPLQSEGMTWSFQDMISLLDLISSKNVDDLMCNHFHVVYQVF